MNESSCRDCGLVYASPGWCDVIVPNKVWAKISPTGDEGGLLCFTCIARRLEAEGMKSVPLRVASGPFRLYWDHEEFNAWADA